MDATTAPPTTDFRRALSRWLFRGVTLVGLGVGMWLLNQGTAAADETPTGLGSALSGVTGSVTEIVTDLVPGSADLATPAAPAAAADPAPAPAPIARATERPAASPAPRPIPSQDAPLGSVVGAVPGMASDAVSAPASPLGVLDALVKPVAAAIHSAALHLTGAVQTVTAEVVSGATTAIDSVLDRAAVCTGDLANNTVLGGGTADGLLGLSPSTETSPTTDTSTSTGTSLTQSPTSTAGSSDRTAADSLAASGPLSSSHSTRVPGPATPAPTPANVPTGDPGGQRSIGQVAAAFAANTSSHGDTGSGATAMSALVGPSPAPAHSPSVSPD